jgi:hypothetical protein
MYFLKTILALIVSLLLLTGCSENYEEYGFKSIEKDFSWCVVRAKLKGNEKYYGRTAIKSSPYRLVILLRSDTFMEGIIHISELKLVNTKTNMVVFNQDNIVEQPFKKDEYINTYLAYFSFDNIELEYEEMVLQMKFSLKQGDKTTEYKAEIFFEKDYRKFRRIRGV